jgi:hypothetical protein
MVAIALPAGRYAAGVGKWGKAVGGECVNPKGCPPPSMAFPHGPEGMSTPKAAQLLASGKAVSAPTYQGQPGACPNSDFPSQN